MSGFLQQTVLGSKTQQVETSQVESIRTSMQTGEWVASTNFKLTAVPQEIHSPGNTYVFLGQSYQFKALLFGLSTAPVEFTMVVGEVKLITQNKCIRICQDQDEWVFFQNYIPTNLSPWRSQNWNPNKYSIS